MSTKPKLDCAMVFQNVSIAVFDETEQQVGELQTCLLFLWAERAELLGYDVNGLVVETSAGNWKLIKGADGWRREFVV